MLLSVSWKGNVYPVQLAPGATIGDLRGRMYELTNVLPRAQTYNGLKGLEDNVLIENVPKLRTTLTMLGKAEKMKSAIVQTNSLPDLLQILTKIAAEPELKSRIELHSIGVNAIQQSMPYIESELLEFGGKYGEFVRSIVPFLILFTTIPEMYRSFKPLFVKMIRDGRLFNEECAPTVLSLIRELIEEGDTDKEAKDNNNSEREKKFLVYFSILYMIVKRFPSSLETAEAIDLLFSFIEKDIPHKIVLYHLIYLLSKSSERWHLITPHLRVLVDQLEDSTSSRDAAVVLATLARDHPQELIPHEDAILNAVKRSTIDSVKYVFGPAVLSYIGSIASVDIVTVRENSKEELSPEELKSIEEMKEQRRQLQLIEEGKALNILKELLAFLVPVAAAKSYLGSENERLLMLSVQRIGEAHKTVLSDSYVSATLQQIEASQYIHSEAQVFACRLLDWATGSQQFSANDTEVILKVQEEYAKLLKKGIGEERIDQLVFEQQSDSMVEVSTEGFVNDEDKSSKISNDQSSQQSKQLLTELVKHFPIPNNLSLCEDEDKTNKPKLRLHFICSRKGSTCIHNDQKPFLLDVEFDNKDKETWLKIGYLAFQSNEESYETSRDTVLFSLKDLHNALFPPSDSSSKRTSFDEIINSTLPPSIDWKSLENQLRDANFFSNFTCANSSTGQWCCINCFSSYQVSSFSLPPMVTPQKKSSSTDEGDIIPLANGESTNSNHESVLLSPSPASVITALSASVELSFKTSQLMKDIEGMTDEEKKSNFLLAAQQGDLAFVKACLQSGISANYEDSNGRTALHHAVISVHLPVILELLQNGAFCNKVDKKGLTPLDVTKSLEVQQYILVNIKETQPWIPDNLMKACQQCSNIFGVFKRRHHCRLCGRIFCSTCSHGTTPLLKFNLANPVRVCGVCKQITARYPDIFQVPPSILRSEIIDSGDK
eukprot:TRINITY_DN4051_c0_g2_i1.p1 TRINITY_DN4051_c0_g2~~TRINITY_DN4051_c0_g2_i1.p1  ORF type:complete len:944 (+),score=230.52 TRINITY_DN4051_c0_g2_i1:210-3041(+)